MVDPYEGHSLYGSYGFSLESLEEVCPHCKVFSDCAEFSYVSHHFPFQCWFFFFLISPFSFCFFLCFIFLSLFFFSCYFPFLPFFLFICLLFTYHPFFRALLLFSIYNCLLLWLASHSFFFCFVFLSCSWEVVNEIKEKNIVIISERRTDDSFPTMQFHIEGCCIFRLEGY